MAKLELAAALEASKEDPTEAHKQGWPVEQRPSPTALAQPLWGCPGTCCAHTEAYKCLFSSFYSKANHPTMSLLAKKKLLAQVSGAESSTATNTTAWRAMGQRTALANPEPSRLAANPHFKEQRSHRHKD